MARSGHGHVEGRVRRWVYRAACSLAACVAAATCARSEPLFDGERAFADLAAQVAIGPRIPGSAGSAEARLLIRERLEAAGWNVVEEPFLAEPPAGTPVSMTNLIATRPGRSEDLIVLAAHYDTKDIPGVRFLGANDGASGVAILLELARVLGSDPGFHTVKLVFFDGEEAFGPNITNEDGLYGSRELALRMAQTGALARIRAFVVFDMVADRDLQLTVDLRSSPALRALAKQEGRGLVEWGQEMAVLDDHSPFQERGLDAVLALIDFQYGARRSPGPLWHTADDDLDAVSADSLGRVGTLGRRLFQRLDDMGPQE